MVNLELRLPLTATRANDLILLPPLLSLIQLLTFLSIVFILILISSILIYPLHLCHLTSIRIFLNTSSVEPPIKCITPNQPDKSFIKFFPRRNYFSSAFASSPSLSPRTRLRILLILLTNCLGSSASPASTIALSNNCKATSSPT